MSAFGFGIIVGAFLWLVGQGLLLWRFYIKPRLRTRLPDLVKPNLNQMEAFKIEKLRQIDKDTPEESTMWVNVIFARIWSELRDTEAFSTGMVNLVRSELIDLKRDPIGVIISEISQIAVSDFHLGDSVPTLDHIKVISKRNFPLYFKKGKEKEGGSSPNLKPATLPPEGDEKEKERKEKEQREREQKAKEGSAANLDDDEAELTVIFDVSYLGGMAYVMEMPTTLGLHFACSAKLVELKGRMFVQFRKKPLSTFSIGFFEMPKLEMEVSTCINGAEFWFFTEFSKNFLRARFRDKFVLPNMKTKWFLNPPDQPPYPWDLKEGEDESALFNWKAENPTLPEIPLEKKPVEPEKEREGEAEREPQASLPEGSGEAFQKKKPSASSITSIESWKSASAGSLKEGGAAKEDEHFEEVDYLNQAELEHLEKLEKSESREVRERLAGLKFDHGEVEMTSFKVGELNSLQG